MKAANKYNEIWRGFSKFTLVIKNLYGKKWSTLFTDISETMRPKIIVNNVFKSSKHAF